jgi:FKBP12-rapamycin complex-associated protein
MAAAAGGRGGGAAGRRGGDGKADGKSDGKGGDAKSDVPSSEVQGRAKVRVNEENLKRAWEASQRSTKEDWLEWTRRLSNELLRESPSPALRAAWKPAQEYQPLVRELFNAAFVSCWSELPEQYQDELVHAIETALMSPNIPPEVLHQLLDLAEFMEHDDKPLPIDIRTLGSLAEKAHAYAKALHYKEVEFASAPASTIEALISVYNELQQPEAAVGILKHAQARYGVELKESWYEKLGRWEDALEAYEQKHADNPASMELTLGRMRCLHALGEWSKLERLAHDKWPAADESVQRRIAPLAAAAAWNLHHWQRLELYIGAMTESSVEGAFFRAISAVHRDEFAAARRYISRTRYMVDTTLTALVGESYQRAYNVMVRVQQLSELEEVLEYKCSGPGEEARRATLRRIWDSRLQGCQRDVDTWQRLLAVRSMVVAPREDMDIWLKFAGLCRKSGRLRLSHKTLTKLMGTEPDSEAVAAASFPRVTFAYIKQQWAAGHRAAALERLRAFGTTVGSVDPSLQAPVYLKLGEWQRAMLDDALDRDSIPAIIQSFRAAVRHDPHWYKAWHKWALINFEVIAHHEQRGAGAAALAPFLVPAVQGFFKSIALGPAQSLQDTLRLLTLWFKHGARREVEMALREGFASVSIDTWLQVIPQIIARIASPVVPVRRLIHELLCNIGKQHPQALVYPLTVSSKSTSRSRQAASRAILEAMRAHSAPLVEQALLVSQELIRVSILWHEMWREALEDASRLYFGDRNVEGMLRTLEPLHAMLEQGPETMREISFQQAYGRDLQEAAEWCQKYRRTGKPSDLNQAWDLYYHVFRRINKQLPQLTNLELQYVSPKLLRAHDLELAVPGTYRSGSAPLVRIARFASSLTVINSKQRPRKLLVPGSDGHDYAFLLKGHEDLRQDERVMQLFGLVNTLLHNDRETSKSHLGIERYAIVPLSPNSGLLSWVPDHDTMHGLIREYRESRKILLNLEHRLMLQMSSDYDHLCLMQKVEVFEHALNSTNGQDLAKVLWLKSRNSEVWLDRRTNFTRSLAVMSMVGYILGLGDRHPSNLMLSRQTGKVLHIDFGDCFSADTPITLANGLARRIVDLPASGGGAPLLATELAGGAVRTLPAPHTRQWSRGVRPTVELELLDGRRIRCTPEHRFRLPSGDVPRGVATWR